MDIIQDITQTQTHPPEKEYFNPFFFLTNGLFVLLFVYISNLTMKEKEDWWKFLLRIPIPYPFPWLLFEFDSIQAKEEPEEKDENKVSQERKNEEANKYSNAYDDKYLEKFRTTPDDLVWTEEESAIEQQKIAELEIEYRDHHVHCVEKISELEALLEARQEQMVYHYEDVDLMLLVKETEKELEEYKNKRDIEFTDEALKETIQAEALQYMIDRRLTNLKNNVLIEKTPLGNVLMFYDKKKESFCHYSDATIPYRFLEVIARRYVLTFQCKNLYVDMEVELKEAERKWQDHKKWEAEQKAKPQTKKDVFAKFKSYNTNNTNNSKNTGNNNNNRAAQQKQQQSFSQYKITTTKSKEEDMILLKERANRYTYEGKFLDYPFLKKPEKKLTDKRQGLSFADFKKMHIIS